MIRMVFYVLFSLILRGPRLSKLHGQRHRADNPLYQDITFDSKKKASLFICGVVISILRTNP